jgi:hypothetical protein
MRIDLTPARTLPRPVLLPFVPPPALRPRSRRRPPRHFAAWLRLASLAALAACGGTIRVVRLTPASGELALVGSHDEAHAQAEAYMRRQCPYGYDVLEEGEGRTNIDPWSSPGFAPARGNGPTAFEQPEWRIRYQCRGRIGEAPTPALTPVASAAKAPVPSVAPASPPLMAPTPVPTEPSTPPPAPSASSSWF